MTQPVPRILGVPLLALALSACTGDASSSVDRAEVASAIGAGGATTTTTGLGVFPVVIPMNAALEEAAAQAQKQSAALDALCATIPINASLNANRPNGTGCPRSAAVAPDSGALLEVSQ